MISVKGICPTCGNPYALKSNGAVRRHNSAFARCFTENQFPREIIRSERVTAERDGNDENNSEENDEDSDPEPDIPSFA